MPAGQNDIGGINNLLTPRGYQQLTPNAATALTVPDNAELCIINAEGGALRFRCDGTSPTASVGQPIVENQTMGIAIQNLADIELIGQSTGVIANVTYFSYTTLQET